MLCSYVILIVVVLFFFETHCTFILLYMQHEFNNFTRFKASDSE